MLESEDLEPPPNNLGSAGELNCSGFWEGNPTSDPYTNPKQCLD